MRAASFREQVARAISAVLKDADAAGRSRESIAVAMSEEVSVRFAGCACRKLHPCEKPGLLGYCRAR